MELDDLQSPFAAGSLKARPQFLGEGQSRMDVGSTHGGRDMVGPQSLMPGQLLHDLPALIGQTYQLGPLMVRIWAVRDESLVLQHVREALYVLPRQAHVASDLGHRQRPLLCRVPPLPRAAARPLWHPAKHGRRKRSKMNLPKPRRPAASPQLIPRAKTIRALALTVCFRSEFHES